MSFQIRQAEHADAEWLTKSFSEFGAKRIGYFTEQIELQRHGKITLLVATNDADYVGHCIVNWLPKYEHFRDNQIPEIQDLNVSPRFRRQGAGSLLMDVAEQLVAERRHIVGIGFALYRDYGPAQQMYVRRGYIPDGQGVAYDGEDVITCKPYPVDDELVLYLTKTLASFPKSAS